MEHYRIFPDAAIAGAGQMAETFRRLGLPDFQAACRWVHALPYGYNTDRDDPMILFKEKMGSCTTKHAVIATLAGELGLAVHKNIGIYAMTEALVTGTAPILARHGLPYLPMVHCFLVYEDHRVDLSQGNRNGKNGPIDDFLFTCRVDPAISARDEYRLYRDALKTHVLPRGEFAGVALKRVLKAREEGLILLRANLEGAPDGGR